MITIETIQYTNHLLAWGGVLLVIGTLALLYDYKFTRVAKLYVQKYALLAAFALTLSTTLMSLVYSEIFGLVPCGLCWLQRMAIYPQVLLLATAIYIKDTKIAIYNIVLSIFGILIGLYQHYIQMGGNELFGCPASGGDCAKRFFFEFNFVTFPLLSVFVFLTLILLYVYYLKVQKD